LACYRHERDAARLEAARAAARALHEVAESPAPGQLRWPTHLDTRPSEPPVYATGLYSGVAGVASFFLELHAAEEAARPSGAASAR
jgi:hypothetical protein